ncbi:MAG: hypothetical protein RR135_05615 [Oscillospiraceae bacterium]
MYQISWIFIIYCFLGWCVEVMFVTVCTGEFVNRGFLSGPVCPIYGVGMVLIAICLAPLRKNTILLFLGGMMLTSLLEWITGFLLERLFGDRWWDYSDQPFNIGGYICLKFSLLWGLGCILVMDVIHPLVMALILWLPATLGMVLLILFLLLLAADTIVSISAAVNMKHRLRRMGELAERLHILSDSLGESLSVGALGVKERFDEGRLERHESQLELRERLAEGHLDWQEHLCEVHQELAELRARYAALAQQRNAIHKHFIRAFPHLEAGRHRESIKRLKQNWEHRHSNQE